MTLAHAGLAVVMAGMIGSSVWKAEVVPNLRPGEAVEIAGYSMLFEGVGRLQGRNYTAERARLTVSRGGEGIAQSSEENTSELPSLMCMSSDDIRLKQQTIET